MTRPTPQNSRVVAVCSNPLFLRFFLPIFDYVRDHGYETHILCGPGLDSLLARSDRRRHQFYAIDMARSLDPARDLLCVAQLTRLFWRIRPDIVHAHGPKAGLLSMLAATAQRVPGRVYSIHGLRHETLKEPMLSLVKRMESVSMHLAHRTICVSPSVRTRAVADLGAKSDQLTVLLQGSAAGIDAKNAFCPGVHEDAAKELRARLGIGPHDQVVGFIGRLARDKGIAELTEAWRRIVEQRPAAHLLVVGELDLTDPVSLDDLRSLPRVHLLGFQMETAPIYEVLDLVVLPTYREGFPQVLLEAAAMQLPAVATKVTGCIDAIVDGKTGVLVPPRDPHSLAKEVIALLNDPERRRRYGFAARQRVLTDYQIEPLARATLDLYESLLDLSSDSAS